MLLIVPIATHLLRIKLHGIPGVYIYGGCKMITGGILEAFCKYFDEEA